MARQQRTTAENGTGQRSRLVRMTCILGAVFILLTALALLLTPQTEAQPNITVQNSLLQISEYVGSNTSYPDAQGNFHDWVELHNAGRKPLSLGGYALTDGNNTWMLPSMELAADGYLVVFCDGEGKTELHANLKLKAAGGETLAIKNAAGEVVESVQTIPLQTNTSAVRGEKTFTLSERPTPGFPNTDEGYAAFLASRTAVQNELVLSEVMAANAATLQDADGQFSDYIEVTNRSDKEIPLQNYGLSNDEADPLKFRFPELTLKPGETVLVFASGKGHSADEAELHATFKLNKGSDMVILSTPAGIRIDSVEINGLATDEALIRGEGDSWSRTDSPSPGYPNTDAGLDAFWEAQDAARPGPILINEAMTRNTQYGRALSGKFQDWIELYNPTAEAVNLNGWHLSNDPEQPDLFALPDVSIPAGGYLIVYATGGTIVSGSTYIQANFKLDSGECAVILTAPDGGTADFVSLNNLPMNTSRGRVAGGHGFAYFTSPTPGAANGGSSARQLTAPPAVQTAAGVYNGVSAVEVPLAGEGVIYYTTDGSVPTLSSSRYTGPLSLSKTTVVRAVAVAEGRMISDVMTASYIINENHTMDVVSLASDPDGLFDPVKGIYTEKNYNGRGMNYERAAHIEFFGEDEPGFSLGCGVRIFGGASRMYEKKSLSIKFRDCYGASHLDYKVFDSRDFTYYNSLLLRSSGQERLRTMFKDAMTTSLVDDLGLMEVQAYRPVVVYINGDYWGVYNIREKIDENFIATHENVSPGSVDLLQGNWAVNAGSNEDYREMLEYVRAHKNSMNTDEVYNYLDARMDLVNYCDYYIAEIYCSNNDAGNIRFYRSSETDGKWRWILYDTDQGFAGSRTDRIWYNINPAGTGTNQAFTTDLIYNLLKNDRFRSLFIQRLEYNMKNVWNTERVLERIDEFYNLYKPEVERNFQRWNPYSLVWEKEVEAFRVFARNRQKYIRKELSSSPQVAAIFKLTEEELDRIFE